MAIIHRTPPDDIGLVWAECPRCEMGWVESKGPRDHECPEPFPLEIAEAWLSLCLTTGNPISMRHRARIKLGLEGPWQ